MSTLLWVGTTNGNAGTGSNFSTGSAPVNADDLYVRTSAVAIDAGLNQAAVTLASLNVGMSMTGAIGTTAAYYQINATNWRIGEPGGASTSSAGNGLWKLDFGSATFTGVVINTSSTSTEAGLEPLRIIGTSTSNKLYVLGGRVGVATTSPTETSKISEFSVSGSSIVTFGNGVTLTTGYQSGGSTVTINSGMTTFTQEAGTATVQGSGVIHNLTVGGACYLNQRPSILSVSGITRTSTTATATTSAAHGYTTGDTVYISGANEGNYNGYFTIANASGTTFDYTISSTTPTPATGSTLTCVKAIASLTVQETGIVYPYQDSRDVYVAAITMYPGGQIVANSANPGHFHYGSITLVSTGTIKAGE